MVGPVVEEIAGDHADKVIVGKVNVDENPATATKFGIMSIPTIILFKDGQPAKKVIGASGPRPTSSASSSSPESDKANAERRGARQPGCRAPRRFPARPLARAPRACTT